MISLHTETLSSNAPAQLKREAAEAADRVSALAEENEALVAKVQRLVPPPDRAGSGSGNGLGRSSSESPTKVRFMGSVGEGV